VLKRQDFPVSDFSGMATTAPYGEKTAPQGENATRRIKGWRLVYTGGASGSKMEIPAEGKRWGKLGEKVCFT